VLYKKTTSGKRTPAAKYKTRHFPHLWSIGAPTIACIFSSSAASASASAAATVAATFHTTVIRVPIMVLLFTSLTIIIQIFQVHYTRAYALRSPRFDFLLMNGVEHCLGCLQMHCRAHPRMTDYVSLPSNIISELKSNQQSNDHEVGQMVPSERQGFLQYKLYCTTLLADCCAWRADLVFQFASGTP